jgi:hypothetical protein
MSVLSEKEELQFDSHQPLRQVPEAQVVVQAVQPAGAVLESRLSK